MTEATQAPPEDDDERIVYTPDELVSKLGLPRHQVFRALRSGDIPARRVGRRYLVSKVGLERWLEAGRLPSPDDELAAYIAEVVTAAPALSADQRDRLRVLLRGADRPG